jgi:DNA-binding Lrp family transcriptional regulator
MVSAVVLIKAAHGQIEPVGQALAELEGVTEVFSVAGRVDLVASVRVSNNDQLADIVAKRFAEIEGVVETETLIAFRVYSKADAEAGFAL